MRPVRLFRNVKRNGTRSSAVAVIADRTATDRSCAVPRTHNTFGDRSFAAAGPRIWNSLRVHLRDEDSSYNSFRRELKTFWF